MLYILFSPAETKEAGGDLLPINRNSFILPSLYEKRLELLKKFEDYKKTLDDEALLKFFDLKTLGDGSEYRDSIFKLPTQKALLRYSGVAYKALDFYSLGGDAKQYLLKQTLIFSNLFGPLLADDEIPNYRLKQGAKIAEVDTAKHYKKELSSALDDMLAGCEILDLRAGYYDKFYEPKTKTLKPTFLKNGKVVSHSAKAYRGLFLRAIAQANASDIKEALATQVDGLRLKEVIQKKDMSEPVFEILTTNSH